MENDNDRKLGDELLKQNGIQAGTLSDDDRKTLHESIALGKKRVRRLKWIVVISWSLLLLIYLLLIPLMVMARERVFYSGSIPAMVSGFLGLAVVIVQIFAMVCTFLLVIRFFSLRGRQTEDIRLGLRDMEAELKQLRER